MVKEKHNGWVDTFFAILEEAQNDNYVNHSFAGMLKGLCNSILNVRGLYKEVDTIVNHMIFCFLSNDPCLYGLTREEWALVSRLVILEFNPMEDPRAFDTWAHTRFDPGSNEFIWSMFLWLRDQYVPPTDYTTNRYLDHPEKDEYIKTANMLKKNGVEMWLSNSYELFKPYKYSGAEFRKILLKEAYDDYVKDRAPSTKFALDNFVKMMIGLGFELKELHHVKFLRIRLSEFEELFKRLNGDLEEEAEVDEGCV
jgi:hypothetical protein